MKRFNSTNLSIESLEHRDLMAADATLANGLLSVQGTNSDDNIVIQTSQAPGRSVQNIDVTIRNASNGSVLVQKSFNALNVNNIEVKCLGGNDIAENNTSKPSTMFGGYGEDKLFGGSADDMLYSSSTFGDTDTGTEGNPGWGDNELHGRGGNDTLMGGSSQDLIFGDAGDDYLYGADGNDELHGGANNDYLLGDNGADDLYGEDGDDYLYAKDELLGGDWNNNYLYGGAGKDTIFGAAGIDYIFGGSGDDTL